MWYALLALACTVPQPSGPLDTYTILRDDAERYGAPLALVAKVHRAAEREGIGPDTLLRLVQVESSFRPRVVSYKGAVGLMQVLPSTARSMGVERAELFNVRVNLRVGTRYLARLLERYGNLERALTAYHWGPGNVARGRFTGWYAAQILEWDLRSYGNRVSLHVD